MAAESPTQATSGHDETGIADLVHALDEQSRAGNDVTLGYAMDHAGARLHGVAILLLALPDSIPLPIPSFGAILGVPLMLISAHLAIFGEQGDLPVRARRVLLPQRMIAIMVRYLAGPLRRAERLSHHRMPALARREKIVGTICLVMSVMLLLPIPLMNVPPAIALVLLSWGLVQRDGIFVGIGMAMAAGVVVTIIALTDLILGVLT